MRPRMLLQFLQHGFYCKNLGKRPAGDVLANFTTMVLVQEYNKGNKDYMPPPAGGSCFFVVVGGGAALGAALSRTVDMEVCF